MRVRVLKAPGGRGMEAERISCLLRKKVTRVKSPGPHPILEVPKLNRWDLSELDRTEYKVRFPKFSYPQAPWISPRL